MVHILIIDDDDQLRTLLGARRTLRKPFALQELRAAVREVLQHPGP